MPLCYRRTPWCVHHPSVERPGPGASVHRLPLSVYPGATPWSQSKRAFSVLRRLGVSCSCFRGHGVVWSPWLRVLRGPRNSGCPGGFAVISDVSSMHLPPDEGPPTGGTGSVGVWPAPRRASRLQRAGDARPSSATRVADVFRHDLSFLLFCLFLVFPNERKYLIFTWPHFSDVSFVAIAF